MQIIEVISKRDKVEFIDFPKKLYQGDPYWVCQLDNAIESVFNPRTNQAFGHGEAVRWILKDSMNTTIGRVAAFIDKVRSSANRQPTGGMGFFEVFENKSAAFILFDTARDWLAERGMEAMDGPINFGENDNNWGLLVEGFMQPGYGIPYHKKYYRSFFEEYGFRKYFEQYSYHRDIRRANKELVEFPDRLMKIADWISKRSDYSFRHFEFWNKEKYIKDTVEIYNSTWSVFKQDFTPLDPKVLMESFEKAKAIIDEELIWFAYYNDKPISFFILLPDLNQILKHLNGKMHLLNMIRFFYWKMTHKMTRLRAVVGGVHPSFQNSGVESGIFLNLFNVFKKKHWLMELELSWVGDFNPRMMAIYNALGATKAKVHITYRYLIKKNVPFLTYKEEMEEKKHLIL
jgi:hypothetical protein